MAKSDKVTQDTQQTLSSLIGDLPVAMLTTLDRSGQLHSRPMVSHRPGNDGELWFFTEAGTPKISELIQDGRVNISYSNPEKDLYVSVSGTAEYVKDHAKARELWSENDAKWFPRGAEDPDLGLIRVRVESFEKWEQSHSKAS